MSRVGHIAAAVISGCASLLALSTAAAHERAPDARVGAVSVYMVAQSDRFDSDQSAASELAVMSAMVRRYLVHGDAGVRREVMARHRDDPAVFHEGAGGPVALHWPGRCQMHNLRAQYDALLRARPDLTHLRLHRHPAAVVWGLIHEDMHCRTDPHLEFVGRPMIERLRADGASSEHLAFIQLTNQMKTLLSEAMSDAMAILMMARRDGLHVAQDFLAALAMYRADRRAIDPEHDTTATLAEVRRILETQVAILDSDAQAFEQAIRAAQTNFFHTFVQQLGVDDARTVQQAEFAAQVARIPVMLERIRAAYRRGQTSDPPALADLERPLL